MDRREMLGLASGFILNPTLGRAQAGLQTIGVLVSQPVTANRKIVENMRAALEANGVTEGRNIRFEYRSASGDADNLQSLANDLAGANISLLIAIGDARAALAARNAANSIPVVFLTDADPVRTGLVASLAKPGGNLTGVSTQSYASAARRLKILADLAPWISAFVYLTHAVESPNPLELDQLQESAGKLGFGIMNAGVDSEARLDNFFANIDRDRAGAILVSEHPFFLEHAARIVDLAARRSMPTIYWRADFPSAGGLASYGANLTDAARQVALQVSRILKGERAGDVPILLPERFEFALNLRTAREIDLSVARRVIAAADTIID